MAKGVFAPQNARYPLHADALMYQRDIDGVAEVLKRTRDDGSLATAEVLAAKENIRNPGRRLYRRVVAHFNDPVCLFYIVDTMVNSRRGHYLRPVYVAAYLNETQPQFFWASWHVGKMMAAVWSVCRDQYLENEYVKDEKEAPIGMGRDNRGKYYVIDPQNGNEGVLWLLKLRGALLLKADQVVAFDAVGKFEDGNTKFMYPAEAVRALAPMGPVRSKDAFRTQLRPGETFVKRTQFTHELEDIFGDK